MEEMMALINGLREENARSREREKAIQRENEEIRRRANEMQAMITVSIRPVEEDVMTEVPKDFRPFSEAIEVESIPRDHRVPTHGHTTKNCFVLGRQIERLIKEGRLKNFVVKKDDGDSSERRHRHGGDSGRRERHKERSLCKGSSAKGSKIHQQAIHGDFNTIAGGFAGGSTTSTSQKQYAHAVSTVSKVRQLKQPPVPSITFSDSDFEGVSPHKDDPIIISAIVMGYNVKCVLVDQGSSADILFWEAFVGMKIPTNQLIPYAGTLVGFAGDQVMARGYANLETTFGQGPPHEDRYRPLLGSERAVIL
ncbi:uncharacterized protein LOC109793106 [Cajanus cajan]|uniref:uncharacterized protein LOC109793106 n=1 Tax=Cajanus cajan TaxID=3821 RepID=UPI00098D7B04|nr:uncharacterized protein LOC109793106 [Cajanus cajan]